MKAVQSLFMVAFAALAGCAGMNQAMQYSGVEVILVRTGSDTYRIFDKPSENRLMITPSIGSSMVSGAVGGGTWGAIDARAPRQLFEDAVRQYFAERSRPCTVTDGYIILSPQWEFRYKCTVTPKQSAAPAG